MINIFFCNRNNASDDSTTYHDAGDSPNNADFQHTADAVATTGIVKEILINQYGILIRFEWTLHNDIFFTDDPTSHNPADPLKREQPNASVPE